MKRLVFCNFDKSIHPIGTSARNCRKCRIVQMRKFRKTAHGIKEGKRFTSLRKKKLAYLAITEVNKAVKLGRLPRVKTLFCIDCGDNAQYYDHREYAKPLDVEPVCAKCNYKRGPAKDAHHRIPRPPHSK